MEKAILKSVAGGVDMHQQGPHHGVLNTDAPGHPRGETAAY
jgi:hypothetical protein